MRPRPEECTGVARSRQSSSAIRHDSSRFGVPRHDLVVLGGLSAPRVHSPQKKRPGVVLHDPNPARMRINATWEVPLGRGPKRRRGVYDGELNINPPTPCQLVATTSSKHPPRPKPKGNMAGMPPFSHVGRDRGKLFPPPLSVPLEPLIKFLRL